MKKFLWLFLLFLLTTSSNAACPPGSTCQDLDITVTAGGSSDEEFVGPFPNWIDAHTGAPVGGGGAVCTGATGNGSTDDAAAIQSCLDYIVANAATAPVLWFPAPSSSYKINSCLHVGSSTCGGTSVGINNIALIGADRTTTKILWGGGAGGVMLSLNGFNNSRVNRLTFDGASLAAVAIDQSSTGMSDTGNEYADDAFINVGVGYRCGNADVQCSETALLRDQFINNTTAGVLTKNFNALDIWVWYSYFEGNVRGVSNDPSGAGVFHVYNSIFKGSTNADIIPATMGTPFNIRGNFSVGSNKFISGGGACGPNEISVQGNTVLDTTQPASVFQNDMGPMILLDNTIRSLVGATGPVAQGGNGGTTGCDFSVFSMGNIYTATPNLGGYAGATVASHSISDSTVSSTTVLPTCVSPTWTCLPTLPGTPTNTGPGGSNIRTIYEPTALTGAAIQTAITNAVNGATTKAVVHIPAGAYNVSSTITVPASDIQIIGDGGNSVLGWSASPATGPMFQLQGPGSKVILRNFSMLGQGGVANGIDIANVDQVGSHVFIDQFYVSFSQTQIFADALDYTNVEMHNTQAGSTTAGGTNIKVVGGTQANAGNWQGGVTNYFAGAGGNNPTAFSVSNGGHLGVRDVWQEQGVGLLVDATGPSVLSYAGSVLGHADTSTASMSLHGLTGIAALVDLSMNSGLTTTADDINITGTSTGGQILSLGVVNTSTNFFNNTATGNSTEVLLNQSIFRAHFTGSISGSTLTVPAPVIDGTVAVSDLVRGTGFSPDQINSFGTGTSSGSGTYNLASSVGPISSELMETTDPNVGSIPLAESGCCNTTFLTNTLRHLRTSLPSVPSATPAGITDVRIHRVAISQMLTGLHLH